MPNKSFCALLLILLICAGCQQAYSDEPNVQSEEPPYTNIDPENTSSSLEDDGEVQADSESSKDFPVKDSDANTGNVSDPNTQQSDDIDAGQDGDVIVPDDAQQTDEPLTNDSHANEPPDASHSESELTDANPGENAEHQTGEAQTGYHLVGLYFNQPLTTVVSKYGEPLTQYSMQGESDVWTVYEYDGFSIGFNSDNRVEFIEVYAKTVDTGLEGDIRVGSSTKAAVTKLGTPTTQSSYVLNYRSQNTTLKMDLDPINEQIVSIKLFSEK